MLHYLLNLRSYLNKQPLADDIGRYCAYAIIETMVFVHLKKL